MQLLQSHWVWSGRMQGSLQLRSPRTQAEACGFSQGAVKKCPADTLQKYSKK
jgi:hypothetical protein